MLRGVTGGNDTVLTDKAGKEHSIGDLLPKMDSIDAGEGTHIIFAPQAGSQRRLPEDLSPFERTVFQHLGLTEARSVIGVLNEFLVDQQLAEDSIGTKITQARDEIEENIKYLQRRRGTILEAPPWGVEPIPSVADTEKKLRSLISGLSDSPQEELPSGISMTALIGKAEEILGKTQDADSIRDLLGQLGSAHQEIEDLESLVSVDISLSAKIETNESLLANILDGRSIVDLASRVEKERDSSTEAEIKQRVARDSATLLSRNQEARVNCPVCGAEHDLQDLKSDLDQLAIEGSNIEASSGLLEAENELKKPRNWLSSFSYPVTNKTRSRDRLELQ
ncbi:MAG: hypothetical protein IID28_03760 [Planctomycetes bacterium]|nr:hypothetical protein [Planctomycetota bacterium]